MPRVTKRHAASDSLRIVYRNPRRPMLKCRLPRQANASPRVAAMVPDLERLEQTDPLMLEAVRRFVTNVLSGEIEVGAQDRPSPAVLEIARQLAVLGRRDPVKLKAFKEILAEELGGQCPEGTRR